MNDDDFLKAFEEAKLKPDDFNHTAHLRLAWLHITKLGYEEAIRRVPKQIKNYVKVVGAEGKFHMTLTVAAVRIVNHYILKSDQDTFSNFLKENPILSSDFKKLLLCHYSAERLNSEEARLNFVNPDILSYK